MDQPPAGAVAAPDWSGDPAALVDLQRYPVDAPGSEPWTAVVGDARRAMRAAGLAELPGFVRADAMEVLVADAAALAPLAWHDEGIGTAYLTAPDETQPEGHPRRWVGPRSLGAVAYDLFPAGSPLRVLYEWEPMLHFVEAILDRGTLYRYADECGALNLAVMGDGDALQWHFDTNDFVVSLAVQDADEGGDFEVVPRIRSDADERHEAVGAVLDGDRDAVAVTTLAMHPGTLLVFEGRHSIHRVTRIGGPVERWVGLLSYDTRPGTRGSARLRKVRYGRD
ncbi:MAG: HalD/BesD family halogenase [Acidimicrobiales bacterium]